MVFFAYLLIIYKTVKKHLINFLPFCRTNFIIFCQSLIAFFKNENIPQNGPGFLGMRLLVLHILTKVGLHSVSNNTPR